MRNNLLWIFLLVWPLAIVRSRPANDPHEPPSSQHNAYSSAPVHLSASSSEQVISVRITSSVAVGRTQIKPRNHERKYRLNDPERFQAKLEQDILSNDIKSSAQNNETVNTVASIKNDTHESLSEETSIYESISEYPTTTKILETDYVTESVTATTLEELPEISGPNVDFLRQLDARKGGRGEAKYQQMHYDQLNEDVYSTNYTEDSIAEPSIKEILEVSDDADKEDNIEDIPLARSVPFSSSKNRILDTPLIHKIISDNRSNSKLTTVSFNIVHDTSSAPTITASVGPFASTSQSFPHPSKGIKPSAPEYPKFYNEPAKIYSQPAKIYSEPAKFYSEPAKVYSEPAKVYGEPAKVYSEPAKIYSEPSKFYSQPASLHLPPGVSNAPWQGPSESSTYSTSISTLLAPVAPTALVKEVHRNMQQHSEKNYEVDEKLSVLTDGRSHGVQVEEEKDTSKEKCKQENCKVGYVVEGRQYKKYQVEEKTADGFIVGEYGVVRNEDGALRGVRYTADSDVSPRLIYDTLMKFLQLK